ncbi:DUF1754-domain-containing protein [Linderina pennispora]|uniref:DUF1754-domain-containing protein n=1 Tax=Linderina pennispora TaxID=61395 RepID=A0A1Y1W634_9FUNG|nr:DUF1754-domain-containing protein [Linderina pennispora]ORX68845.1 DUF1754-domain-containing protein [Linderina pennispora]
MSAYDNGVVHGSLKLKKDSKLFKKKSKKSKKRHHKESKDSEPVVQAVTQTEAERKFEQVQRKRQMERIEKMAAKSHSERVREFNNKLEQAPEHNEMPKVGPG